MKANLLKMGMATLAIAAMLSACKKDNNSDNSSTAGNAQVAFGLKADGTTMVLSSNATGDGLATQASASGSINWTNGTANVSGFKLEVKRRDLEIEIKSKALTSINIFAPIPQTVSALIDTGTYREIELRVMLSKTSGADIPLTLKGTFITPGGASVPIELDFNDDATIKLEMENVTVDNTTDLTALVTLKLNKLFDRVSAATLDAATRTSGTIIISSSSNTGIYNTIKNNVGNCGSGNGFERHDRH